MFLSVLPLSQHAPFSFQHTVTSAGEHKVEMTLQVNVDKMVMMAMMHRAVQTGCTVLYDYHVSTASHAAVLCLSCTLVKRR